MLTVKEDSIETIVQYSAPLCISQIHISRLSQEGLRPPFYGLCMCVQGQNGHI